MKVALEARVLGRPASGVRTYVRHLLEALRTGGVEVETLESGSLGDGLWPLWLEVAVPPWLAQVRPSVVHFTKAALPFGSQTKPHTPTVVTIYDVIPLLFPQSQKMGPRLLWPAVLRHAGRAADHIITISEASKRDIVERLQVAPDKVTVTPLAVDTRIKNEESQLRPKATLGEARIKSTMTPYILFLSTLEPRKNVPALVRAYGKIAGQIPHQLLIAGRPYKGAGEIEWEIGRLRLLDRVKLLGAVASSKLADLYANASLFVLPSVYEGWSFPAQEAMSYGVPVIVSDGGALPEVVGEAGSVVPFSAGSIAARTHDEGFESALADQILEVLTDSARQTLMSGAGRARAHEQSWQDVVKATIEVYNKVIS